MRHSGKRLDTMLSAERFIADICGHVSVSLRGAFAPKVYNKMERGKHRRSLLEYAHKDVHRHTHISFCKLSAALRQTVEGS